jgi:hypothetical protein
MEKMTQLSIAMENAPGQLGRVCRALAQANVNIRGISVSDATDISTIRLLVNDVPAAKKVLREAGVQFVSQEVLVLDLEDKPGALEKVASRLGEAGVNIHYLYGTGESGQKGVMVLRVSDVDRARQALGR